MAPCVARIIILAPRAATPGPVPDALLAREKATRVAHRWSTVSRMAIHPDLLEILACPVCKTPVELVKDGAGLRCGQCKRVYPVRDDIPIMLPEEATVEG
jgi:hypothetical protein